MAWFFKNLIGGLLMPPFNLLLAQLGALILLKRRPRLARALLAASWAGLLALSVPVVSLQLIRPLEDSLPALNLDDPALAARADAIVALGGGRELLSPEYGGRDMPSEGSFLRLRYAADLNRRTRRPILVAGGSPGATGQSEAALMAEALHKELGVDADWIEEASENTAQNAELSYAILQSHGIKRIFLVTHAWHMPRAYRAFKKAGFEVVPAPMDYSGNRSGSWTVSDWLPNSQGMEMSYRAFHEGIGAVWYRLTGAT